MKNDDPLLGTPRRRDDLRHIPEPGERRRRWPSKLAWVTYGHIAFGIAAIIGWEHLDVLWPRWIWPNGVQVGPEQHITGLLTVGDHGRPAMLTSSAGLLDDWRFWIRHDMRQESAACIGISAALRAKLLRGAMPRPGSAGLVQYWVDAKARDRLGPARCGDDGGLAIVNTLEAIEELKPVPCSRDVFVAHGFICPGERREPRLQSETFADVSDYYPWDGLRGEMEGTAAVRIERDETGSPVDCRVLQSSGHEILDQQTCKLVGVDPAFTYANRAGPGADLAAPIIQRITWRLPEEPSPRASSPSR